LRYFLISETAAALPGIIGDMAEAQHLDLDNTVIHIAEDHYQIGHALFESEFLVAWKKRYGACTFAYEGVPEPEPGLDWNSLKQQMANGADLADALLTETDKANDVYGLWLPVAYAACHDIPYRLIDMEDNKEKIDLCLAGTLPDAMLKRLKEEPYFQQIAATYPRISDIALTDPRKETGMVIRDLYMAKNANDISGTVIALTGKSHAADGDNPQRPTMTEMLLAMHNKTVITISMHHEGPRSKELLYKFATYQQKKRLTDDQRRSYIGDIELKFPNMGFYDFRKDEQRVAAYFKAVRDEQIRP
jgi:hypothetical protein